MKSGDDFNIGMSYDSSVHRNCHKFITFMNLLYAFLWNARLDALLCRCRLCRRRSWLRDDFV